MFRQLGYHQPVNPVVHVFSSQVTCIDEVVGVKFDVLQPLLLPKCRIISLSFEKTLAKLNLGSLRLMSQKS